MVLNRWRNICPTCFDAEASTPQARELSALEELVALPIYLAPRLALRLDPACLLAGAIGAARTAEPASEHGKEAGAGPREDAPATAREPLRGSSACTWTMVRCAGTAGCRSGLPRPTKRATPYSGSVILPRWIIGAAAPISANIVARTGKENLPRHLIARCYLPPLPPLPLPPLPLPLPPLPLPPLPPAAALPLPPP